MPKVSIIDEGSAVSATALWQCTTCAACMEACPVYIEQMPKIVDARRWLVMEQAEFPENLQAVVNSLEQRSHPFPGTSYSRVSWTEGLNVKVMGELPDPAEAEVLLWVGCGGALVERNQKSTRALAQLLTEGGVKFAILGREEGCTGDPARRIGNEFLFEMLAKTNVETLERLRRQEDRHLLPALLQHLRQRVSAARRPLRGDAPHPDAGVAGGAGKAAARRPTVTP